MRNLTTNVLNFSSLLLFHFQLLQLRKDATWGFPHLLTFAFCPQIPHSPTIPNGFHPESRGKKTLFDYFPPICNLWCLDCLESGSPERGKKPRGFKQRVFFSPKNAFACSFFIAQNPFYAITADCRNSLLFLLPFSLPSTSYIYLPPRPNQTIPDLKFGAKIYGGKLGVENWGQKIWGQKLGVENLGQKIWGGKLGRQITSKFSTTIFLPENISPEMLTFLNYLPETGADDLEMVIKQRYWRNISECVWRLTQWSHYYYCPFHAGLIIRRIHLFINSWLPSNVPHNFTT